MISVQITLTNVYQKLTTLIAAKRVSDGFPPLPELAFRTVKFTGSKSVAGIISGQITAIGTNPFFEIEAGESFPLESGNRFKLNSLEGIFVKSTINAATEKLDILLQE